MATAKRGLVDKVKKAAARAGSRGAQALVDTAVAATRTVDALQTKLERVRELAPGLKKAKKNETAAPARTNPLVSVAPARPATAARGVIESAKPARKATTAPRKPRAVEAVAAESGRKTVPTQAAAAKRSTAKRTASPASEGFKVKRGQKHRHHR